MENPINNKNHRITIRLTEGESEQLKKAWKNSSDLHLSSYIRKVLLDKPIKVFTYDRSRDHFMEEAVLLRRELSALGNNFNQVVRNINALPARELSSFWLKTATSMQKELINKTGNIQQLLEKMWNSW